MERNESGTQAAFKLTKANAVWNDPCENLKGNEETKEFSRRGKYKRILWRESKIIVRAANESFNTDMGSSMRSLKSLRFVAIQLIRFLYTKLTKFPKSSKASPQLTGGVERTYLLEMGKE
jgi:hypothetical protein